MVQYELFLQLYNLMFIMSLSNLHINLVQTLLVQLIAIIFLKELSIDIKIKQGFHGVYNTRTLSFLIHHILVLLLDLFQLLLLLVGNTIYVMK